MMAGQGRAGQGRAGQGANRAYNAKKAGYYARIVDVKKPRIAGL